MTKLSLLVLLIPYSIISYGQKITTIAGGIGDNRPALEAQLIQPMDIAIDQNNNLYIADTGNRLIRKINATTGLISTVAGNGEFGSDGDGALAVNAQLYNPAGVEMDGNGNLFICDRTMHVIRRVNMSTGVITSIAGVRGSPGFSGDGGQAVNANLNAPRDLCFDGNGNIYFVEENGHRVRRIDSNTGIISTIAGTGTSGFGGDGGPASNAILSIPSGLVIDDDGNLLIVDAGNNRIRKIDLSNNTISTIAGNGVLGANGDNGPALSAELGMPAGIAVDASGNIFISDYETRVRKIDIVTGIINTVAGIAGSGGFSGDGGLAVNALLYAPRGLMFDSNGNLYIVDYGPNGRGRIRKVDTSGVITTAAGNGGFGGDGGLAGNATIQSPRGIAFDSNDNLLFADGDNYRIRKIDNTSNIINTIAGTGVSGFSGDSQLAINAQLGFPQGIALDASDNIYFTDQRNSRIRKIESATGVITTIAGNGSYGYNGDNIAALDVSMNGPDGITVDVNGDIYFADTYSHLVRKISASTNLVTTIAGSGSSGFTGDGGSAVAAKLSYPIGVALHSDKLFIADKFNNRIRQVDLTTGIITTIAGGGFSQQENSPALDFMLSFPIHLVADHDGNLIIVTDGKVYRLDKATNFITTFAGSGLQGFSGDNGPAPLARMLWLAAAAFDSNGNLFISDGGNNRIRKVAARIQQTITFNALPAVTVGDSPILLTSAIVSASSALPLTFTSSNPSLASINGNQIVIHSAGSVTITAVQIGDDNVLPVSKQQNLTIHKQTPTISITSESSGERTSTIKLATDTGGSNGSVIYSVINGTGSATVAGEVLSLLSVGTVTVQATVSEDNNYAEGFATQIVTIEKKTPILNFTSATNAIVNSPISLSIDREGSTGAISFAVINSGMGQSFSLNGNLLTATNSGSIRVRATIAEDNDYKGNEIDQSIIINSTSPNPPNQAKIWGTSQYGGYDNAGVIFSSGSDGTNLLGSYEFNTDASGYSPGFTDVTSASNGKIYGLATQGGIHNHGTLFEYDLVGSGYSVKFNFGKLLGSDPVGAMVEGQSGKLYGTTYRGGEYSNGVLFEYDLQTSVYTKKHDFDFHTTGSAPSGYLLKASNGKLYGTTSRGGVNSLGVLFEFDPSNNSIQNVHDFDGLVTGSTPLADLMEKNGKIIGTTSAGGSNNVGVLFEYNLATGDVINLHDFTNQDSQGGLMAFVSMGPDDNLYGVSYSGGVGNVGFVFKYDFSNQTYSKQHDFDYSDDGGYAVGMKLSNGKFYGAAFSGGAFGQGTLYEYDPIAAVFSKLLDMNASTNGRSPAGALVSHPNGNLYGLTNSGGVHNAGTLFEYAIVDNTAKTVYAFKKASGGNEPLGKLTRSSNGKMYGLSLGGETGQGTIFELDTETKAFSKKADFNDIESGITPTGSLLEIENGKLLGVTISGGAYGQGVIFQYDPILNVVEKKYDFHGFDGTAPQNLFKASNNKIYGTTKIGGANGVGVLFTYDPVINVVAKLFDFDGTNSGNAQYASLMQAANGKLYGLTQNGGSNNLGVLFEFDIETNAFKKKVDLEWLTGALPISTLVQAEDGLLYAVTLAGGSNGSGTLVSFNPESGSFLKRFDFEYSGSGGNPQGEMTIGHGGKLYGTAKQGGSFGQGTLFEFDPLNNSVLIKSNFTGSNGSNPNGDLILVKLDQLISFPQPSDHTFGDGPFDPLAISNAGLGILYTSNNPNVAVVNNGKVQVVGAGNVTITAHQSGNYDYRPAGDVSRTFTVNKMDQAITFNSLATLPFSNTPVTLSATATSGLTVSYVSSNTMVATISGNAVTIVGTGTADITAKQIGNANYNPAVDITQSLIVKKGNQTIAFNSLSDKSIIDAPFQLTANSTSGLPISYLSSDETVATVSGGTVTIKGFGTTTITARQSGNSNYNAAADVSRTLIVGKSSQVITFYTLAPKIIGDAPFTLSAMSTSGLDVSYSSSDEAVAKVTGNTVTIVGAGTANITAKQAGNSNYNPAADVIQLLTVDKINQTITFNSLATKTFGDAPFTLSATSTSGLDVSYSSSDEAVATVSGNTVTIVGAGTVNITAKQAGNSNYGAASEVIQALTVSKAEQSITFSTVATKTLGDAPFNLNATSNSGLAIEFTPTSDKITLSGNQVTLVSAGSVTVKGDQSGNSNYNAATSASQTFCINPARPTITTTGLNTGSPLLTSSNSTGNQWYKNGVLITGATSNTFSPSDGGSFTVKTTVDNCSSELSTEQILVVTGDIVSSTDMGLYTYPNPASHSLTINLTGFDIDSSVEIIIHDMLGKEMDKISVVGERTTLSVTSYSRGTYFIKASQGSKIYVEKFIRE